MYYQKRPVWNLGTKPKNSKNLSLGPYFYLFIGEILFSDVGKYAKIIFLAKSKKSVLDRFYIHFNRPTKIFLNFEFTLVFV